MVLNLVSIKVFWSLFEGCCVILARHFKQILVYHGKTAWGLGAGGL